MGWFVFESFDHYGSDYLCLFTTRTRCNRVTSWWSNSESWILSSNSDNMLGMRVRERERWIFIIVIFFIFLSNFYSAHCKSLWGPFQPPIVRLCCSLELPLCLFCTLVFFIRHIQLFRHVSSSCAWCNHRSTMVRNVVARSRLFRLRLVGSCFVVDDYCCIQFSLEIASIRFDIVCSKVAWFNWNSIGHDINMHHRNSSRVFKIWFFFFFIFLHQTLFSVFYLDSSRWMFTTTH